MAVMESTGSVMLAGEQTTNVAMTGVDMDSRVSTSSFPTPHQPGIGFKPGTQVTTQVLQAVKQVQEEAARQAPHPSYGKVAPGGGVGMGVDEGGQTSRVMPPSQVQQPIEMPNPSGSMNQWAVRYLLNSHVFSYIFS